MTLYLPERSKRNSDGAFFNLENNLLGKHDLDVGTNPETTAARERLAKVLNSLPLMLPRLSTIASSE